MTDDPHRDPTRTEDVSEAQRSEVEEQGEYNTAGYSDYCPNCGRKVGTCTCDPFYEMRKEVERLRSELEEVREERDEHQEKRQQLARIAGEAMDDREDFRRQRDELREERDEAYEAIDRYSNLWHRAEKRLTALRKAAREAKQRLERIGQDFRSDEFYGRWDLDDLRDRLSEALDHGSEGEDRRCATCNHPINDHPIQEGEGGRIDICTRPIHGADADEVGEECRCVEVDSDYEVRCPLCWREGYAIVDITDPPDEGEQSPPCFNCDHPAHLHDNHVGCTVGWEGLSQGCRCTFTPHEAEHGETLEVGWTQLYDYSAEVESGDTLAIHTDGHKDGGFGISDPDILRDLRSMIDVILREENDV